MPDMPPGEPIIRVESLTAGYEDKAICCKTSPSRCGGVKCSSFSADQAAGGHELKHMIGLLRPVAGPPTTSTARTS